MDKPLKVCLVTQQLGSVISGIGFVTRNLLGRLLSDQHEVTVIAPLDQKPRGTLTYQFIEVPKSLGINSQARWLSLSWSFRRALDKLPKCRFDLIYFTDAREALFSTHLSPVIGMVNDTYAAETNSIEYYRKHYGDWLSRWLYYNLIHQIEKYTYARLNALVTNSQHTARTLKNDYALSGDKIHVCYYGIDPKKFALTDNRSFQNQDLRILFIGGNMQRKGLPTLIEAAPQVLTSFPNAKFWVIGKDRVEAKMRGICQKFGVSEQFRFWGLQPNEKIPDFMKESALFVLPSLTEAFGIVLLEAMAAGVPVIGTRVGGIPEFIEDGVNGFLVEPNDPPALSRAIVKILGNQELAIQFRRAGLKTVEKFKLENSMSCNYRVFKSVLGTDYASSQLI